MLTNFSQLDGGVYKDKHAKDLQCDILSRKGVSHFLDLFFNLLHVTFLHTTIYRFKKKSRDFYYLFIYFCIVFETIIENNVINCVHFSLIGKFYIIVQYLGNKLN